MKFFKPLSKTRKITAITIFATIIATVAFLWFNSMMSKTVSGNTSGSLLDKVKPFLDGFFYPFFGENGVSHHFFRKLAHWSEYFLLGTECTALLLVLGKVSFQRIFNILSFGALVALIDESIQILTSRGPAVIDILIDCWGYASAFAIIIIFYSIVKLIVTSNRKRLRLRNSKDMT